MAEVFRSDVQSNNYGQLTEGDDVLTLKSYQGTKQIHTYARGGDDYTNMGFVNINGFSHGQHVRGGHGGTTGGSEGADTFNFIDLDNVHDVVVGRIEDFDASRDTIAIEGTALDLNNLGAFSSPNVVSLRLVAFNGAHNDAGAEPQHWLLIETATGGTVFYALEGARVDMTGDGGANGGEQERHFIIENQLPDFSSLQDVAYIDPKNYVPEGFQAEGGIVINDTDRNSADAQASIQGSEAGDLIAAGLNADTVIAGGGDDKIWGGDGQDSIDGGQGHDQIDGGRGVDVATYHGKALEYQISVGNDGQASVVSHHAADFGTDSLQDVERIHFSGNTLATTFSISNAVFDTSNAYSWHIAEHVYDSDGQLTHFYRVLDNGIEQMLEFTNGARTAVIQHDGGNNAWQEIRLNYDPATGNLLDRSVLYDDGKKVSFQYENDVLIQRSILDANGFQTTYAFEGNAVKTLLREDLADEFHWTFDRREYDLDTGLLSSRVLMRDDGIEIATLYTNGIQSEVVNTDLSDVTPWRTVTYHYDDAGTRIGRVIEYDDGRIVEDSYMLM